MKKVNLYMYKIEDEKEHTISNNLYLCKYNISFSKALKIISENYPTIDCVGCYSEIKLLTKPIVGEKLIYSKYHIYGERPIIEK